MNDIEIMGLDEVEQENTSIDDLEVENVNLIFTGIDSSSSMYDFISTMQNELQAFKNAILNTKEVDEILIAKALFASTVLIEGYKNVKDFNTDYIHFGMTALYDVCDLAGLKLIQYMNYLKSQGVRTKAVFSIFSDGEDNHSQTDFTQAKKIIAELNKEEIVTAFICFGNEAKQIAKDLGFKNILEVGVSDSELRKAFDCLSKSVISNSKSVINKTDDFFEV